MQYFSHLNLHVIFLPLPSTLVLYMNSNSRRFCLAAGRDRERGPRETSERARGPADGAASIAARFRRRPPHHFPHPARTPRCAGATAGGEGNGPHPAGGSARGQTKHALVRRLQLPAYNQFGAEHQHAGGCYCEQPAPEYHHWSDHQFPPDADEYAVEREEYSPPPGREGPK